MTSRCAKCKWMFYFFPSLPPPGVSGSPGTSLPAPVVMVMPAHSGRGWLRGYCAWLNNAQIPPPARPPSLYFFHFSRLCEKRSSTSWKSLLFLLFLFPLSSGGSAQISLSMAHHAEEPRRTSLLVPPPPHSGSVAAHSGTRRREPSTAESPTLGLMATMRGALVGCL